MTLESIYFILLAILVGVGTLTTKKNLIITNMLLYVIFVGIYKITAMMESFINVS